MIKCRRGILITVQYNTVQYSAAQQNGDRCLGEQRPLTCGVRVVMHWSHFQSAGVRRGCELSGGGVPDHGLDPFPAPGKGDGLRVAVIAVNDLSDCSVSVV